jgi:cation diffusion facilitator family transporter
MKTDIEQPITNSESGLSPFRHRRQPTVHWRNSREMHQVIRAFRGTFRALLLELLNQPLTRSELRDILQRMGMSAKSGRKTGKAQLYLEQDLEKAKDLGVVEEREGKYFLTPSGRELSGHMQMYIPEFMSWLFSASTASLISLWVHVVLSILKLGFGLLSNSAGLIADGIDNTVDTLSSFLVWVGIKYDKERLVSIFILITMFVSVGGVALAAYEKVAHPGPITEGLFAFVVSAICGLVMLGLSSYQYMVGQRSSNLAILCQAADSRNHFLTSLMVCAGILLSFLADVWSVPRLYYADAAASAVIGILILKSAIELGREILKSADEPADITHFMKRNLEKRKEKIIFEWLKGQLQTVALTRHELVQKFIGDFCEQTPKIIILSGMGYQPDSGEDLIRHLDRFVEQKKLVVDEDRYWLAAR